MQKFIIILAFITISCKGQTEKTTSNEKSSSEIITTSEFKLIKAEHQKGLLILFPCFPCDAENTLNEFKISDISVKNGFSVLAMNLNELLYLKPKEKQELAEQLTKIISEYNLPKKNIFVGGFSSGGNVSLTICDYLVKNKSQIQPKGVFVVDSPVDLLGLYKTAEKNLKLNFSEPSVAESKWIKEMLDNEFGNPENGITNYELNSPYTLESQNIENLKGLEKLKIRFYIEPDLKWWNEHAKNDYKDLNAFYIQKLSEQFKAEFGENNIELIKTENRGYRANGERHPHSWSIVNEKDLVNWLTE
ncbi:alpha/beta hydrolase fold domain-containing protein [Tamlana sp. 2_MG-2023]|uniref:alpha/beta hydrolase fold domain-containing protein n=1 Tax=unclassified Tamlana TaxID=2614803 RepID=UPI0026E2198C|nr:MULTISPECIES: alpha/beta hydrolase fold domain-containing protein [unclassified Tamlana]MDO6759613.1 alpha/beta hydrolase fold domain-containing protein [Tamlana sp. 2_MG-2023]MDO6792160.1 alpha/beta hydrolase fold domain-containing protein [Tamlana sp. 1_MG-2023]